MEGNTIQSSRSMASWWIMAIVALLVGGLIGYYLGTSGVGTGLVPDEPQETSTGATVETQTEEPANPFEDDGYQNPFE